VVLVSDIKLVSCERQCELRAEVKSDAARKPFVLWYRFPLTVEEFVTPESGDPFVASLLLIAMKNHEMLEVRAPVSPKLLRSVHQIQAIYKSWNPALSEVRIKAPVQDRDLSLIRQRSRAGIFFSCGVNSFYSLLKNQRYQSEHEDTITHLIVLQGFDIYFGRGNTGLFPSVLANAEKVAHELAKELLPVATNLRDLSDRHVDWGLLHNGAALASIGLALENMFDRIYITSTHHYGKLVPLGSSPCLDPMWSTESLSFLHDGCEASRLEKIRFISQSPIAMQTLRVCFMNPRNEYNCGRCEKCLRTMIGLHIAGALQKCTTLPHRIDPGLVRDVPIRRRTYVDELIDALGSSETDLAIKSALKDCLSGRIDIRIRQLAREVRRVIDTRLHRLIHNH